MTSLVIKYAIVELSLQVYITVEHYLPEGIVFYIQERNFF